MLFQQALTTFIYLGLPHDLRIRVHVLHAEFQPIVPAEQATNRNIMLHALAHSAGYHAGYAGRNRR